MSAVQLSHLEKLYRPSESVTKEVPHMDTFAYGRGVPAELRTFPEHLDCTFIDLCEKSAIHNMTLEQKWMETGAEAKLKHVLDIFFSRPWRASDPTTKWFCGWLYVYGRPAIDGSREETD